MLYFVRRPSQLFLVTQKHTPVTIVTEYSVTEYAQCIKERHRSKKKFKKIKLSKTIFPFFPLVCSTLTTESLNSSKINYPLLCVIEHCVVMTVNEEM